MKYWQDYNSLQATKQKAQRQRFDSALKNFGGCLNVKSIQAGSCVNFWSAPAESRRIGSDAAKVRFKKDLWPMQDCLTCRITPSAVAPDASGHCRRT